MTCASNFLYVHAVCQLPEQTHFFFQLRVGTFSNAWEQRLKEEPVSVHQVALTLLFETKKEKKNMSACLGEIFPLEFSPR